MIVFILDIKIILLFIKSIQYTFICKKIKCISNKTFLIKLAKNYPIIWSVKLILINMYYLFLHKLAIASQLKSLVYCMH